MKNPFRLLIVSIIFLSISAISIALIPLYNLLGNAKTNPISYIGTALLWIGIIGGYVALFMFIRKHRGLRTKGRIGVITFFRNRYASIADVVLVIALVLIVVLALLRTGSMVIYSLLFGIVFLFFNLHCIFNGRVFHTLIKKRSGRNG